MLAIYKRLKKYKLKFHFLALAVSVILNLSNCVYSAVSSTDMLNDELKRRMTSSQGGLTPRVQRKGELCCVVVRVGRCTVGSFIFL